VREEYKERRIMDELINKKAAVAMAEKIVEEVDKLTVDIEEKKAWARELMNSVLPYDNNKKEEVN
jgi:SOS response regulatory protein OraA/RecX